MSSDPTPITASPGYALGRLHRAVEAAQTHPDPAVRARAQRKADRWAAVLEGMATGALSVGSRTPVADTPAWVTLEVATGGFATGRYLAEQPLDDTEQATLDSLPDTVPGRTPRERLNLWYLGDAGLHALREALRGERFRVDVPEEGALLVVAWLLEHGHAAEALRLVDTLRPLMHRLRFTPTFSAVPRPAGAMVRVVTAGQVAAELRRARARPQIAAMNETLRVWNPLFDKLVALWCETVQGELPHLRTEDDGTLVRNQRGEPVVAGGWPCTRWPQDWSARRDAWFAELEAAVSAHPQNRKTTCAKGNFARLRAALHRCPTDSRQLSGRDVGWIRRALANTITRHGAPHSDRRAALRGVQAVVAAQPSFVALAKVVAQRLDAYPADGGLPALEPIATDVTAGESPLVPEGHPIPPHLTCKAQRALEAPIHELVERGVISSGEVLAQVLPQITAQVATAGLADPELRALYGQIYAAFRRRRSLLLLNLEHQVQLEELPWIAALAPLRKRDQGTQALARQTMEQTTLLALSGFPQTILPNPLLQELRALARQSGLDLPLVEEVAADIFMGTFTPKWRQAAERASALLEGTLYARYYDLPEARIWAIPAPKQPSKPKLRAPVADDFASRCTARSAAANADGSGSYVAVNGTILEQSQVLTTQNLAVLVHGLSLQEQLRVFAPELAARTLRWIVRRQTQKVDHWRAQLQMIKNTAYAWRQAIFYLSFTDTAVQRAAIDQLWVEMATRDPAWQRRFRPAVDGLAHAVAGGRFDASGQALGRKGGRRFLGWSVGRHWMQPQED